ncbi:hypothetical protein FRC01_009568, partial [Tulasnella sp. 417]
MVWWRLQGAVRSKSQEPPPKIAFVPHEVLLPIIESLDEQSVGSIVQTCRFFRNLAEPFLYRHIRVYRNDEEVWRGPLKAHLLHRTLVGRPDLLLFILSYHGPLVPNVDIFQVFPHYGPKREKVLWRKMKTTTRHSVIKNSDLVLEEYLERAKIIFRGTTNMQELHVTDRTSDFAMQIVGAVDASGSKILDIKRLALQHAHLTPWLNSIVRAQPGLKHLELHDIEAEFWLDDTDLPELESLRAGLVHAARIVPGRPVKKLELLDNWPRDQGELWQKLTLSTCNITEFIVHSSRSWAGASTWHN